MQDNRPLSKNGGLVQLFSYQETTPSRFKGLADSNPPAPELVRLKADDPNRAAASAGEPLSAEDAQWVRTMYRAVPVKR